MDEKDLTGWFPASVKPARPGVYQTKGERRDKYYFSRFDGENWYGEWFTAERAVTQPPIYATPVGQLDASHWRGLAHPPKGA